MRVEAGNYSPDTKPTIVLKEKNSVFSTGDLVVMPGGKLDRVQIEGLNFWRIVTRDQRRGDLSFTMFAYLDGHKVSIDGTCPVATGEDQWALLLLIAESFTQKAPTAILPETRDFNSVAAHRKTGQSLGLPTRLPAGMAVDVVTKRVPQKPKTPTQAMPARQTDVAPDQWKNHPLLNNSTIKIPLGHTSPEVTYSDKTSDFVLVNSTVYRLRDNAPIRHFPGQKFDEVALSPEAKWLAATIRSDSGDRNLVIHSVKDESAEPIQVVINGDKQHYRSVRFLSDEELLIGVSRPTSQFVTWDIEGQKIVRSFECNTETYAVSHDAAYLAVAEFREVKVYDLANSKVVATMDLSAKSGQISPHGIYGLTFNSDVTELAAFTGTQLVTWSQQGTIRSEFSIPGLTHSRWRDNPWMISLLPENKGWLIDGRLVVLREPQQRVFVIQRQGHFSDLPGVAFDTNRIISPMGSFIGEWFLADITIPWSDIEQALRKQKQEGMLLEPGDQLAVNLAVGPRRLGPESEARETIMSSFRHIAGQAGLTVGDHARVALEVDYSESPAKISDTVPSGVEMTIEGTQLLLKLRLRNLETSQVIWNDQVVSLNKAQTAEDVQTEDPPLHWLLRRLDKVKIPLQLAGDGTATLPVEIDLEALFDIRKEPLTR